MTMKIFAHNALIDGVFQPATIEVSGDVISHIEPGVLSATSAVDVRFDHGYVDRKSVV